MIFSREGVADFQKNFEHFVDFFKVEQSEFPSSTKALKRICYSTIFCAVGKNLKNSPKKNVFRHCWKNLTKKSRFFGALPPQN